jgi:hypothetical protein
MIERQHWIEIKETPHMQAGCGVTMFPCTEFSAGKQSRKGDGAA